MKKITTTLCLLIVLLAASAQADRYSGNWVGKLNVGVTLNVVFHVNKSTAGLYSATMDSPDQGANGIPVSKVAIAGDSITITLNAINGKFEGKLVNDSSLNGQWSQGPGKAPLSLKKSTGPLSFGKPQTPKPPFSYESVDVEYDNADRTVHLGATLTFPKSGGPFPTAILISGSGQQDRESSLLAHKPFAVIADELTKNGIAVLRVDDRGTGKSKGDVKNSTSADYAKDVETSLAFLKTRAEVDQKKVGLIGHSEGGLIAAIVGASHPELDFIILLAGPGVKGSELMGAQTRATLTSEGLPENTVNAYVPFYNQLVQAGISGYDSAKAATTSWNNYLAWKKVASEQQRAGLGYVNDETAKKIITGLLHSLSMPWFKFFMNSEPAPYLSKISSKVLAVNGSKDIQVLAGQNLSGIRAALQKGNSKVHDIVELPGLNHLFQTCKLCSLSEYGILEESFSPVALKTITDWLKKNVQQ